MGKTTNGLLALAFILTCTVSIACQRLVLEFHPDAGPGPMGDQTANCQVNADWLPTTPSPALTTPDPHPATECPFYEDGFQYFLMATQPDTNSDPAFATYATVDDMFMRRQPLATGALAPAGTHRGTALRAWLGDVKQPGGLVEQLPHLPQHPGGHGQRDPAAAG